MVWDELARDAKDDNRRDRDKWIGVWIGVLAVALAVCTLGGGNAAKDAMRANIDATNTWAFFQARNLRRTSLQLAVESLEIDVASNPLRSAEAKTLLDSKLKSYREQIQTLTSDKVRKDGLDELWEKAKGLEKERDAALAKDPYFDWGQALLQISIVLASVAIVAGGNFLLGVSGVLGIVGTLLTINGFLLIFKLPFLG